MRDAFATILGTLALTLEGGEYRACTPTWAKGSIYNDPFGRLYWVRGGEGWTRHHGREYLLRPGSLFVIPAHTPSQFGCPRAMELCWVHFTATVLHGIDLFTFLDPWYAVPVEDAARVDACWDELLARMAGGAPGDAVACDGLLRQLLARFIDRYEPAAHDQRLRGIAQFHSVLGYIEEHLAGKLTLATLADLAHLQPTYFSNAFSRTLGESPMAYVTRRRIERAKRLLWDTTLPLHAIASTVGFCDAYYFSRTFKRLTHLTPGEFRRLQGVRP